MLKYFFLICWLLLFLGKGFSKLNLFSSIYAHDFALFLPLPYLLINFKIFKNHLKYIFFIVVVLGYLIYSFIRNIAPIEIILRQFMLFGYLISTFIYFNYFMRARNFVLDAYRFLILFSKISIVIHVSYLLYCAIILDDAFFEPDSYHYYSPISIFGLIIFGIYILLSNFLFWYKSVLVLIVIFLLSLTGHSSAFLAYVTAIVIYYYKSIPKLFKLFALILILLLFSWIVYSFSSFTDVNAMWRLFYWFLTIKKILVNNFGILGFGFGVPYADDEVSYFLEVVQGYTTNLEDESEKYLSPMHNSFITMAFNIGAALVMIIFIRTIYSIFHKTIQYQKLDKIRHLFALALIAMSVWCSLNVVLELPHSAILFWFVYFTTEYVFSDRYKVA